MIGRCLAAAGRAIGEYCDTPAFHAASKLITDLLLEEGFLPNRAVVCGVKAATSAGAALLSGLRMNGRESAAAHTHIGDGSRWLMSSDPAPQHRVDRRPFSATPNDRSAPRSAKLLGGTAGVLTATPTHLISLGCAGRPRTTTPGPGPPPPLSPFSLDRVIRHWEVTARVLKTRAAMRFTPATGT